MNLLGNRANETYTYRRVDWDTWQEGADLGNVTSGSVELSALSDLKATCSFSFIGGEAPEQDSLVRIYYSFTDDYGETKQYTVGTFIVCYSSTTNIADYRSGQDDSMYVSGSANGYSVLKVLKDRCAGMPLTIKAGSNAVEVAKSYISDLCGLRVDYQPSTYTLVSDHTFEPDDSYLAIVNWLLSTAGYASVSPSKDGVCQMFPSIEPTKRGTKFTFTNDDQSIMYPEVVEENDWQDTPNVARLYYETDELAIWASASNVSGSKASLESRGGRELTIYEDVSELEGGTPAQMLSNMKDMALRKLVDNSSEIEHVKLSHPYIDLFPNDAIEIDYSGKKWSGNVTNVSVSLQPSTKCDTEIRRFIGNDIVYETDGAVIWEAGV